MTKLNVNVYKGLNLHSYLLTSSILRKKIDLTSHGLFYLKNNRGSPSHKTHDFHHHRVPSYTTEVNVCFTNEDTSGTPQPTLSPEGL